jgi:hypothetical protein
MSRLDVTADLRIEVDGTQATLVGSGDRLVLETTDPGAFWSALLRAELPAGVGRIDAARALGRIADGLRDAGVRVDVRGPRGRLVALGAGVRSPAGRLGTGSSALRPGGPRALAPLVLATLRDRPVVRSLAGVALGALGVVLLRRATRR